MQVSSGLFTLFTKTPYKIVCADCRNPFTEHRTCPTRCDVEDGLISNEDYLIAKSRRRGQRITINAKCQKTICIGCSDKRFRRWGDLPDDIQRAIFEFVPEVITYLKLTKRVLSFENKLTREVLSKHTISTLTELFHISRKKDKYDLVSSVMFELRLKFEHISKYENMTIFSNREWYSRTCYSETTLKSILNKIRIIRKL